MAVLVERDNIGIFGKMNAGKSTAMNLITQQETSIIDSAAGTTADTKLELIEIHGMGPVKLFDTAGIDEKSALGKKKKEKVFADLKTCDLVLLVINPSTKDYSSEKELLLKSRELDKQILIVYNVFNKADVENIDAIKRELPVFNFYKFLILSLIEKDSRKKILEFILENFQSKNHKQELLPFIQRDEFYILNIPMDEETPPGRYLRPQAMTEEYITRHWAYPVSYRMDLSAARDKKYFKTEKLRFQRFIKSLGQRPKVMITDSQAMDVVTEWLDEDILLTTFSIAMINYFSRGKLQNFVNGIKMLKTLKSGDKVLIVEACNHSRVGEDIGTVQIPQYFEKRYPGVILEHDFGRGYQSIEYLNEYKLLIHCGGCMLSAQQLSSRIRDFDAAGVAYTNYGLFLSYMQGEAELARVLKPWIK